MMYSYPAVFIKETDGRYTVVFPDLSGAATCGDDLKDAMTMAEDCMAAYISTLEESKMPIPASSDMSGISPREIAFELVGRENFLGAFANYVAVDVHEYARTHFN